MMFAARATGEPGVCETCSHVNARAYRIDANANNTPDRNASDSATATTVAVADMCMCGGVAEKERKRVLVRA